MLHDKREALLSRQNAHDDDEETQHNTAKNSRFRQNVNDSIFV